MPPNDDFRLFASASFVYKSRARSDKSRETTRHAFDDQSCGDGAVIAAIFHEALENPSLSRSPGSSFLKIKLKGWLADEKMLCSSTRRRCSHFPLSLACGRTALGKRLQLSTCFKIKYYRMFIKTRTLTREHASPSRGKIEPPLGDVVYSP
jgi:hypothetical protein